MANRWILRPPVLKKMIPGMLAAALLAAAAGLSACSLQDGDRSGASGEDAPSASDAGDIRLPTERPERQPSDIPDMRDGEMERVADNIEYKSLPAAPFSEAEIQSFVEEALEAAMVLDENTLEHFSPLTHTGEYNRLYHMLWAALENEDIRDAFVAAAGQSQFQVRKVQPSPLAPDAAYAVEIETTTPYLEPLAQRLMADPDNSYGEERDSFFAWSGAARAIAGMDLSAVPTTTDCITLNVTVIDGNPLIFHPTSSAYREPCHYAFLWGGYRFAGNTDGDLVYDNFLGGAAQADADRFAEETGGGAYVDFLTDVLTLAKQGELDRLKALTYEDVTMDEDFYFGWVLERFESPDYQRVGIPRLSSMEYEIRYYTSPDASGPAAVQVTLSVEDPDLGARVHYTRWEQTSFPAGGTDSDLSRAFAGELVEDALGVHMHAYV